MRLATGLATMRPSTIFRIAVILLGIASAVLMAHSAFGIRFNEDFLLFLAVVRDIVGVVVLPFELLIVVPVVRFLHEHGLAFELRDHWRHAFVLLWLYNASATRAFAPPSLIFNGGNAVRIVLRWASAALAALLGGALAGTVSLEHPAVLWWSVAAFFLYWGADNFIFFIWDRSSHAWPGIISIAFAVPFAALALGWVGSPVTGDHLSLFWWPAVSWFAFLAAGSLIEGAEGRRSAELAIGMLWLAFAAVSVAFALGVVQGPAWLAFEHSPSPGLANLAAFVVVVAASLLPLALLDPDEGDGSFLERVLRSAAAQTAFDIFAVLGGAMFIVYLAYLMS